MKYVGNEVFDKIANLKTYRRGDRRAPHKPLLLLVAIGELTRGKHELSYSEIEESLTPLLQSYAPPVRSRHQPELPYWHLMTDDLWSVQGAKDLPRQSGGFPRMEALRDTSGALSKDLIDLIQSVPESVSEIASILLQEHFPSSVHEDIAAAVGIELAMPSLPGERPILQGNTQQRDPSFRKTVLRAYEHKCAVTGFRAALKGNYFGCEAAHVRWHAYDGPDIVANGIVLEPTMHKLFDSGAWTMSDDRKILVSREFTGSDIAVEKIRALHGRPIRAPLYGEPKVDIEFIRWHREPVLGGVFKHPALDMP